MSRFTRACSFILSLIIIFGFFTSAINLASSASLDLKSPCSTLKKVKVIPPSGLSGDPGDIVPYIFRVQNIGAVTDSYNYTVQTNNTLWDVTGQTSGNIGPLDPGMISDNITVFHHIWIDASAYDFCALTFTTWSMSDLWAVNDSAYTTTTANPVSNVSIDPPTPSITNAYPGNPVVLTFTIWNHGNWDDTYKLSVDAQYNWPATVAKEISITKGGYGSCPVTVQIPSFNPKWTEDDFKKNGTFYNSYAIVTLTATAKYMPIKAVADAKIKVMPYYQAGLTAVWNIASVDYYNTSSTSVNNKAYYLLKVSNMNNYPTQNGGTAVISLVATPPISTTGTPSWSAGFDPASPFTVLGRDYITVKLVVTEPPDQASGSFFTTITGTISPQAGSVSDPVYTPPFSLQVTTKVGVLGGITVTPDNLQIDEVVTTKTVPVKFDLFNYGSGKDTFRLNASTTHDWQVSIQNGTSTNNPVFVTIDRETNLSETVFVSVPDGVKINVNESIFLKAVSLNDPVNGTDIASCVLVITTLFRVNITSAQTIIPIAPGQPLDMNYTVANLGSETETVYVSYMKSGATSSRWEIPTDSLELVMKSNTYQTEDFTITPPADPAWHESINVIIHGEIRNVDNQVIVTSDVNLTVQVRMLLILFPIMTDNINTYAVPGENHTYHFTSWNLGTKGPDNVSVQFDFLNGQPVGWDAYFSLVGSNSRYKSSITSPILYQYNDTFEFNLILNIPSSAEERSNVLLKITAKNVAEPSITDFVTVNITLVMLDLSVERVYLSDSNPVDNEMVNITTEISAGSSGIGVSKDATHVEVVFTITADGYYFIKTENIAVIPKGTSVNITISWTVPQLKWYERSKSYRIYVNASSPDESTGANTANNEYAIDVTVAHSSVPAYISAIIILVAIVLLVIIFIVLREFTRLREIWKLLIFISIAFLVAALFGGLFLIPSGSAGIAILFITLLIPIPGFTLYSYLKTKSVFIGTLSGIIIPTTFGVIVGAGSGGLSYIASVFTDSIGGLPFAYSLYTICIVVMSVVFGILTKWLWTHASNEILKVEMKIKDIKKA